MTLALRPREVAHLGIAIRPASVTEIDTLCEIDLDASALFERAGLHLDLPSDHEFAVAERSRWLRCVAAGTALLAVDTTGEPIGFAAAGVLDDEPYLDQLSVRMNFMRRGIGSALLGTIAKMAKDAGAPALWLTTYNHLPWNRPFYEHCGFVVVPEHECGPNIAEVLACQRRWLPMPEERVVMRRMLIDRRTVVHAHDERASSEPRVR